MIILLKAYILLIVLAILAAALDKFINRDRW